MKQEIRESMLEKRKNMDASEREWKNKEIVLHLQTLDVFMNAKKVMLYIPVNNEVDVTKAFIKLPVKKFLPFIEGKSMHAGMIEDFFDIEEGHFRTKEPKNKTPEEYLDVILVPGLAFDRKKNRIGYGKGFYDNFLMQTRAVKVGLAYQFQIKEIVPSNDNDIPMDIIITEEGVIE